ncbi:MAG TPA: hypothetical protein VNT81_12950 [Vicinamibacterales bacterium]|nr:hypothetical protein [Vicinamibacterales bacterium]
MKTTISRLLVAAVLAIAAWLSYSESQMAAQVADARQAIATFDHANAESWSPRASLSDYLPGDRRSLADDVRVVKARVAYWLGRYDGVAADTTASTADGDILLAVANAAFRDSQRDTATGSAAAQRLDGVLQAYASALKASPRNAEAAYNYEFVSRLRDRVARTPQGRIPRAPGITGEPVMAGDLPAGPTIHGNPGAPPPDTKMEELQMIAPMDYGDRESQPTPTPGARRDRKG